VINPSSNCLSLCVGPGCSEAGLAELKRGRSRRLAEGAAYRYQCLKGAVMHGPALIYCDGQEWSRGPPACIGNYMSFKIHYNWHQRDGKK
jgi:Sushi repeat (SCR repeat)